jgi:hypothetical protein
MMSFKQYLAQGARLDEGFIRSAALMAWANKSKVDESSAAAALQDVKQAPLAGKSTESLDD